MWYNLEKKVKTWAVRQLDRRLPRTIHTPEEIEWSSVKRILVIRQHDQFGDFLLTTPAIRALRNRFPSAYMALVVRPYLSPVAQNNPDVDDVFMFQESGWGWRPLQSINLFKKVRNNFDLAVVFNTVSHSLSSDLIARISQAPLVLGPAEPTFDHCDGNPFYTLVAPVDVKPKHQLQRNLDVVRYIGADTQDESYGFALTDDERISGFRIKSDLVPGPGVKTVAVHFGTKDLNKRYPIPRLAALCNRISQSDNQVRLIIIRAPGETAAFKELVSRLESIPSVAPEMKLREVAALLNAVDLLVCNDTGILHLASGVKTPTVSFHAISDPAMWKPPGSRHRALHAENGDISTVPVDLALGKVMESLNLSIGSSCAS